MVLLTERIIKGRRAIKLARVRGIDTAAWERHLECLLNSAEVEPEVTEGRQPWMLWEWRRVSTPEWRRVLIQSINDGDTKREEYARWMLRDILLDSDYQEPGDDRCDSR